MKTSYTEKDGLITEEVHTQPTLTISHSRKISDNNYGSNDYFVAMQLDVPIDATDSQKKQAIHEGFTLIRNMIELQHAAETGAPATLNEARIAADLGGEIIKEQPKQKTFKKEYASTANKPESSEAMWQELVDIPTRWFINRDKPTKSYPDFKRKGTNDALWFDKCPPALRAQVEALLKG